MKQFTLNQPGSFHSNHLNAPITTASASAAVVPTSGLHKPTINNNAGGTDSGWGGILLHSVLCLAVSTQPCAIRTLLRFVMCSYQILLRLHVSRTLPRNNRTWHGCSYTSTTVSYTHLRCRRRLRCRSRWSPYH